MDFLPFQDQPPYSARPTSYDERHLVTYLRLLDAEEEGELAPVVWTGPRGF